MSGDRFRLFERRCLDNRNGVDFVGRNSEFVIVDLDAPGGSQSGDFAVFINRTTARDVLDFLNEHYSKQEHPTNG